MNKVKNSFGGIIIGIILLIGGTCLLWWNEGENVKNINAVKEVQKEVVTVSSDSVDSKNEGKLVLTSGKLTNNDEELKDEQFGVSVKSAALKRDVEVYVWVESSTTDDNDHTTYSYTKEWRNDLVSSSDFHEGGHENPTSLAVDDKVYSASKVSVGAFDLSEDQKSRLSASAKYTASEANVGLDETYSFKEGYITTSKDINNPEVGDIRITWTYNDWTEATVLGVQKGSSFVDFVSKDGKKINRVEKGTLSADELILKMEKENKLIKWILRGVGALLIIFGYSSILKPLTTIASFVPVLGGIVGGVLGLIAFLVGLVHSLIIIVIAWFRFRPILAIILLAVIVVLVIALIALLKKAKKNAPAPAVTEAKVVE